MESTEEAEERSADAAHEGIVVGVRETVESEVADGHRDVRAASVSEVVDGQGDVPVSYTHLDVYKRQM